MCSGIWRMINDDHRNVYPGTYMAMVMVGASAPVSIKSMVRESKSIHFRRVKSGSKEID